MIADESLVGPGFVADSCSDASQFIIASDQDLWDKAGQLHAARALGAKVQAMLSTASGLTYVPEGFLWDLELRRHVRPVGCLTHDPLHVVFEHGCVEEEYTHLLPRLFEEGITWSHIVAFCTADWCFPKMFGSSAKLRSVLNAGRREKFRKTGVFAATASEHLMLLPVFLYFLETVVLPTKPTLSTEIDSYRALACVCALLSQCKTGSPDVSKLTRACRLKGEKFNLAYADHKRTKRKLHWLHHT